MFAFGFYRCFNCDRSNRFCHRCEAKHCNRWAPLSAALTLLSRKSKWAMSITLYLNNQNLLWRRYLGCHLLFPTENANFMPVLVILWNYLLLGHWICTRTDSQEFWPHCLHNNSDQFVNPRISMTASQLARRSERTADVFSPLPVSFELCS